MPSASRALLGAATLGAISRAAAFSFSYGSATQCDNLDVSWSGGTSPFQLLITPSYGTPHNISIPSTAYSNGKGSYSLPLPFPQDKKLLLTMSDATGFNTGGTSDIVTVGASQGGSCNSTDIGTSFFYQLNTALVQCRVFTFEGYTAAVQPVTILGMIPGGNVVTLYPPSGPTTYEWTADVPAGTDMIFVMTDSQNRQGGSAELRTVGQSGATDCLNSTSPQSTSNAPSATSTAHPSSTPSSSPDSDNKPSTALIVGSVLGVLLVLACVGSLLLFFVRRRRARNAWSPHTTRHSRLTQSVDLLHPGGGPGAPPGASSALPQSYSASSLHRASSPFEDAQAHHLPPGHEPEPFMLTTPTTPTTHTPYADDVAAGGAAHSRLPSMSTSHPSSAARRKAAMAGTPSYQQPSRFILHTDIEEAQPNEDGFIELPPQYSAHRAPVAGVPSTSAEPPALPADPFQTPTPSRHPSDAPVPEGHPAYQSDARS